MRLAMFLFALYAVLTAAVAQPKIPLRRAVEWQVVPEQRFVQAGKPMVFILEVRNVSGAPIELRFSSGQQFDILVFKEGEWGERWRWSKGKVFTLAFTSIRLNLGEVKRFRVEWDQRDNDGRQVPPGRYRVEAVLLMVNPQGRREELKASASFTIRPVRRQSTVRIRDLFASPNRWIGQVVTLEGLNEGWNPYPNCPMCAGGPPVSRSDWVLRDDTGCIYVTKVYMPAHTRGRTVVIEGVLRRNSKGQIYLEGRK